jgi:hypothetical protein
MKVGRAETATLKASDGKFMLRGATKDALKALPVFDYHRTTGATGEGLCGGQLFTHLLQPVQGLLF